MIPSFRLRTLLVITAIVGLTITAFSLWRRWYDDYTITEFSTAMQIAEASIVVNKNGQYQFTVQPDQEISLQLHFYIHLANQYSSESHSNSIQLKQRELITGGYDFVVFENLQTSQKMTFGNGDVVRFYWMTESIDANRSAIHSVANHFRNGQLIDTKTDNLEIDLKVENVTDGEIDRNSR